MGSNTSKPTETADNAVKMDLDNTKNPDPRSPTPEILRTPLQGNSGSKHNITKNVDLRKAFEEAKDDEKLIHNNPILTAVIKNHFQLYDPRSPTQEIERTPLVIASKGDNVKSDDNSPLFRNGQSYGSPCLTIDYQANIDSVKLNQELVPKNLCPGFYNMTLDDSINDNEEPLGSSTASNDAIQQNLTEENIKQPHQLLETNFDYVEQCSDKYEDSEDIIQPKKSLDTEDKDENFKNIPLFKILEFDPRSPSLGIERTPIIVSKVTEDVKTDKVEEMSDDRLIKVLQTTNELLRQNSNTDKNTLDGLLIYEDATPIVNNTPKKPIPTYNNGSRTPLSCMKNKTETSHGRSKANNFDSASQKLMTAKNKKMSYIPRLKSLSKQTKTPQTGSSVSLKNISKTSIVSGDCENTPPHSHRDKWDKDNSVVL